ncbi:MAG: DUF4199 domain-containing protein [Bacteroidales bacterium]|nr:DUF4199 domain-containing protein [Bacteroidales bacterium]
MNDKKSIWSAASAPALLMGGISVAYIALGYFTGKLGTGFLSTAISAVLWIAKLIICVLVFKHLLQAFSASDPEADNARVFKFGVVVALLSSLVYSAAYLCYMLYIVPDMISEMFARITDAYSSMMDSNSLAALEKMEGSMPSIAFFSNLVYCFLFGTILSAILSRNIPPRNPFERRDDEDGQIAL